MIILKSDKKIFLCGMMTGAIIFAAVIIVTKYLGFHILPEGSFSDKVWEKAKTIEKIVDENYIEASVKKDEMVETAAKGMIEGLGDKYSTYYTAKEYEETMNSVNGNYTGIGVSIQYNKNTKTKIIENVQEGMPGDVAGIKVGDELVGINGEDVTKYDINKTMDLIKGKENVTIKLLLKRMVAGKKEDVTLNVTTKKIINKSVSYKMLENKVGYIGITRFDNESSKQFTKAVDELEKKGQGAMIVDVRNNGGGSLPAVVDVVNRLLPEGIIVSEKTRDADTTQYKSTGEKHFDKPLFVLINGNSASASEIFAGSLQDRKLAKLVGEKSYGKGVVQTIFSLKESCGGGLKLTTGEYFLPSGRSIHEVGLKPDYAVKYEGKSEKLCNEDDNQLIYALKQAQKAMKAQG